MTHNFGVHWVLSASMIALRFHVAIVRCLLRSTALGRLSRHVILNSFREPITLNRNTA